MRKLMWLLAAIVLGTTGPAAQAQFGPSFGPRPVGPYAPNGFNRSNPLAPQVPGIPGKPGGYNPLHSSPFTGPSLSPQPWMSPTLQNIYRDAQIATAPWPNQAPVGLPGLPGGYTLVLYACFAFNWSTRQYVGHAFSRRDIVEGAWNLRRVPWMSWLLLHGEWDLNHHRRPDVPWFYLPRLSPPDEPRMSYTRQYWRQWLGPRLCQEPEPQRGPSRHSPQ